MLTRFVRLTVALAMVAGLVWLGRRALIRWVDGPPVEPSREPWPQVDDRPAPVTARREAVAEHGPRVVTTQARLPAPAPAPAPAPTSAWVEPGPDGCPATHPIKAKQSSKLYHLPGMSAYARCRPDRCYADPEAAEADGFTRAKR